MNVRREPEVKALLDAPDHFALAAVLALGWPEKQFSRLTRQPVSAFTTIDRVTGAAFA